MTRTFRTVRDFAVTGGGAADAAGNDAGATMAC